MTSSTQIKKNAKYICGIDEAGRGPVLGPMVIAGVKLKKEKLDFLLDLGVKDSKKLNKTQRTQLSKKIRQFCHCKSIIINAKEIDDRIDSKISLNKLEAMKMAEIINSLKPNVVYVDAADVNEKRYGSTLRELIDFKPVKIISKHKADETYPIVSAASIVAKDLRDTKIRELQIQYGDFGSGYPSDEKTITFLTNWIKKYKKAPEVARKTWQTVKNIMEREVYTRKISDFT